MPRKARAVLFALLGLVASAPAASAAVELPSFFSEHMVLQRDLPIPVWGRAAPGEKVTVKLGTQAAVTATTAADGTWKVKLPASAGGGPFTLVVKGGNELRVADVLVGEVWLCSGQSNMEFTVDGVNDAAKEKAEATDGAIRQLYVPRVPEAQPTAKMDARWTVCSPATAGGFTACGYFMARQLRKELGVPIGLINTSWGGTRIEPWAPAAAFAELPALKDIADQLRATDPKAPAYKQAMAAHLAKVEAWTKEARAALAAGGAAPAPPALPAELEPLTARKDPQQQPTTLYNGMIHALVGYGLRGAIWYQGESNHYEGALYTEKMKALIYGWRAAWGIGDFPFEFVQIAPFEYGGEDPNIMPRFWLAQTAALAIPNTGMVVTTDIGNVNDIHPKNKQEVGRRLALLALDHTYGKTGVVSSGPVFGSLAVEKGTLRVVFDHAEGLATRDGKAPDWFEICGEDSDFVPATAVIEGRSVVLSAPQVANPTAVRFAWHRHAEPNLMNGAGLPANVFTSGSVAYADPLEKIADAKGYVPAYALDLAKLGGAITYDLDAHATVGAFSRVAYLMELQREGRSVQYAWAAMDAFTTDAAKIAIPTVASDVMFQQVLANLTVVSNVPGVANGSFATGGNIEFWPNNYAQPNTAGVPGASDALYDFGDQPNEPKDGYGCMQVHNSAAKQTVFAINNWKAGGAADLGMGNNPATGERANPDWTFAANGGGFVLKKLRVFVLPKK
jgi:sialate O-acetylesterase